MKAMIFAAGLGTRLKPLTDTLPKALVPIGGRPLLDHVARKCVDAGFDTLVINLHHFPEKIISYVRENGNLGAEKVCFSREDKYPLETGGGIRKASCYLKGDEGFLVHNTDIISNLDLGKFISSIRKEALATLVVSERKTSRYLLFDESLRLVGWTNVETGEVRSPFDGLIVENCRKLAFAGIHFLSQEALRLLECEPEVFPIMDFYLNHAATHEIRAYLPEDFRMIDVGKLDTLKAAEKFLLNL